MREIYDPQWSNLGHTCCSPLCEFKTHWTRGRKLGGGTFAKVYWVESRTTVDGMLQVRAAKLQERAYRNARGPPRVAGGRGWGF